MLTKRDFYNNDSPIDTILLSRDIRANIKKNKNSIMDSTFKTEKYNYNKIPAGMSDIEFRKLMKKKEIAIKEKNSKLITKKRVSFRKYTIQYIESIGSD